MASLRFASSFSQPNGHRDKANHSSISKANHIRRVHFPTASVEFAAAAGASVLAGVESALAGVASALAGVALAATAQTNPLSGPRQWLSVSLAQGNSGPNVVEPRTGSAFPSVVGESRKLLGIGLRRKSLLGLKNIDVYAFGVYAADDDLKRTLGEKYGKLSASSIQGSKELHEDLMEADIGMTVRLQILYSKLNIRSVRSAFEESVGSRLQKFGGTDNKELLQRFTSQFKDEYKIPRGSVIELSKDQGYILCTTIDGKEVGSIQSKLLCRSLLDLYIGEDPFDKQAKEDIESKLASVLQK